MTTDFNSLPGSHNGPWLFAHRGTSTLAPENTAAAFDVAMRARAEVLEIDVRISRDQQIIVTHDATLERTTNGEGLVSQLNLIELKALDAGYQFTDANNQSTWRGKGLTLLTLHELFDRYPNVGINIDIKDREPQAAQLVADAMRKLSDGRWINAGSFHPNTIQIFRNYAPELSTTASQWDVARLYFGRWLPQSVRETQASKAQGQVLQLPTRWFGIPLATAAFISAAQQQKRHVMYWTINDPMQMQKLLQLGTNGLVSDNVLEARMLIDQWMHRSK